MSVSRAAERKRFSRTTKKDMKKATGRERRTFGFVRIGHKVLARVNEHSVDSKAFVDFPLFESVEVRLTI